MNERTPEWLLGSWTEMRLQFWHVLPSWHFVKRVQGAVRCCELAGLTSCVLTMREPTFGGLARWAWAR